MRLILLHLTDLHVDHRIVHEQNKIDSLINILGNDDFSNNILVIFSGDLAFSGKKEQYNIVYSFLEKVKNGILKKGKKVYIAICPGNHDREFAEEEINNKLMLSLNSDNYISYLTKYEYLLEHYYEFENRLENHKKINELLSSFDFSIDGKRVCVHSLNNSYLTAYSKKNKKADINYENIFIPNDLLQICRKNETYSFLIMHMPLRYLNNKTRNYLDSICSDNIDIVFDGHVHDESITIKNEGYAEITSSALYSDDLSGMTLIHLDGNKAQPFVYVFDTEDNVNKYRRDSHNINSFSFKEKMKTIDGFLVNKEMIDSSIFIKINDEIKINIDDIFVFPTLSEERYKLTKEKRHIESFEKFKEALKNKKLINIIGEDDSGKTTLARQLFYCFIQDGKSPLLCDGKLFESEETKKNVKDRIVYQLGDNYINKRIEEDYFEIEEKNRILILDNYEFVSINLLSDCLNYFDKVIVLSNTDVARDFDVNSFSGIPHIVFNIEPLFRSKREEMCKSIYNIFSDINLNIKENATLEQFLLMIEKMIDKMDISYMTNPSFLLDLSAKALLNIEIYTSGKNLAYLNKHYNYLIEKEIIRGKHEKCTSKMVERMLADVAFNAYKERINDIDKSFFEDALLREIDIYETAPFNKTDSFIDFLIELKFIKESQNNASCYQFSDIKVFSYFVGKYAMMMHNSGDESVFELIVSRGIYSKLNFNILMSIAYSYDIENIPNYFVKDLYEEVCVNYHPSIPNLNGIKTYFLKEKKRIAKIDENERIAIREKISEEEFKSREEYIGNIDNYYYEKTVDNDLKELIELSNKNQIVASLLNSSDLLKGPQKKKLMQIAITLPNITIDKYIKHVQKQLDVFYIKILDEIEKEKDISKTNNMLSEVDTFFDYLISIVTATILMFYDNGSRPLNNPIMNDQLQEALKNNNNALFKMPSVQRLMLMSFSNKEETFIKEIVQYIDEEKDSYNKHAASLIARRYCIDNFDHLRNNRRAFLKRIQDLFGKSIMIEAKRK